MTCMMDANSFSHTDKRDLARIQSREKNQKVVPTPLGISENQARQWTPDRIRPFYINKTSQCSIKAYQLKHNSLRYSINLPTRHWRVGPTRSTRTPHRTGNPGSYIKQTKPLNQASYNHSSVLTNSKTISPKRKLPAFTHSSREQEKTK